MGETRLDACTSLWELLGVGWAGSQLGGPQSLGVGENVRDRVAGGRQRQREEGEGAKGGGGGVEEGGAEKGVRGAEGGGRDRIADRWEEEG